MSNKKFCYRVKNATESEMVQRIAFSFGFEWAWRGKEVAYTEVKWLCFEFFGSTAKHIYYSSGDSGTNGFKKIQTLDVLFETLKTPPVKESIEVGFARVFRTGAVKIGPSTLSPEEFDEIYKARKEFLAECKL